MTEGLYIIGNGKCDEFRPVSLHVYDKCLTGLGGIDAIIPPRLLDYFVHSIGMKQLDYSLSSL